MEILTTIFPSKTEPVGLGARLLAAREHLIKFKAAKPAKVATLHNFLHVRLGNTLPASTIDVVCSELLKRGYVKTNGRKVTYALGDE